MLTPSMRTTGNSVAEVSSRAQPRFAGWIRSAGVDTVAVLPFTKPLGGPLSPNTDYHDWKRLLEDT
jgi:hypothetical protein